MFPFNKPKYFILWLQKHFLAENFLVAFICFDLKGNVYPMLWIVEENLV